MFPDASCYGMRCLANSSLANLRPLGMARYHLAVMFALALRGGSTDLRPYKLAL